MRKFRFVLYAMLAMLVCSVAYGANTGKLPNSSSTGFRTQFESSDSGKTIVIGRTFPAAIIGFEAANGFDGDLYACGSGTFAADTCDLITELAIDFAPLEYQTTRMFYIVVVTTGDASVLTIRGTFDSVFRGGTDASGVTSRETFAVTFNGGGSPTVTDGANNIQLELDMIEYNDSLDNIDVSADGNLICNTTSNTLANMEFHVAGHMSHLPTGQRNFLVRLGTCTGCIGSAFPQLSTTDVITDLNTTAAYTNNLDAVPIPIVGVFAAFNPGQCFGLMVFGDSGRSVEIVAGGMMTAGANPEGVEFSALTIAVQEDIEASKHLSLALFGGSVTPTTASAGAFSQLEWDATYEVTKGTDLDLSADADLLCNNTDAEVSGLVVGNLEMMQNGAFTREITVRLGRRTGEGLLADGDELPGLTETQEFGGAGIMKLLRASLGVDLPTGDCIGFMLTRSDTSGGPDATYEIVGGGLVFSFTKDLNP